MQVFDSSTKQSASLSQLCNTYCVTLLHLQNDLIAVFTLQTLTKASCFSGQPDLSELLGGTVFGLFAEVCCCGILGLT